MRLTEDDSVQLARVGADEHGGRVDELVVELQVRVLLLEHLRDDSPPEARGREDVGLVDRVDRERGVGALGEVRGEAGDALDFGDRVGAGVKGLGVRALGGASDGLAAVAKVDAADQLADDDDLGALGDVLLERGVGDEGGSGEDGGTDVGVEAEGLAEREETDFRPEGRVGSPFRAADRTCRGISSCSVSVSNSRQPRHVPRRIASASLHAARVESGSGFWWLSIAIPPKSWFSTVNLTSECWEKASRTLAACAVTSGPCIT